MEDTAKKYHEILRNPHRVFNAAQPTDFDYKETQYLIQKYLKGRFFFTKAEQQTGDDEIDKTENEEMRQRFDILRELEQIIKAWIVKVAMETGMNEELARQEVAKILPFGSHRLGVNFRGGDIDTLVLAPNYVKRDEHFFGLLPGILRQEPDIEELVVVNGPSVTVPLIKMKFHKISFDLLFASLDQQKLDEKLDNLNDDKLLTNMDDKMKRSVNGCRAADMILQCVDSSEAKHDSIKIANFRTTLKLVKLWAKNKGLYSNALGYLGGIAWAILVAKICQMFPNSKPNKLFEKFFMFYSEWFWHDDPVFIDKLKIDPNASQRMEESKIMQVWTPAWPSMNSAGKVRRTNLKIISKQLQESWEILKANRKIKDIADLPKKWDLLFKKYDFLNEYSTFIEINIVSRNELEFVRWKSYVESQIITYIAKIENYSDQQLGDILEIHPYTESFEKKDKDFEFCLVYYFGIKLPKEWAYRYVDLRYATIEFMDKIKRTKTLEYSEHSNVKVYQIKRNEVPENAFDEDKEDYEANRPKKKIHINPEDGASEINVFSRQNTSDIPTIDAPPYIMIPEFVKIQPQPINIMADSNPPSSPIKNVTIPLMENNGGNFDKNILINLRGSRVVEFKKKEIRVEEKKQINILDENSEQSVPLDFLI